MRDIYSLAPYVINYVRASRGLGDPLRPFIRG